MQQLAPRPSLPTRPIPYGHVSLWDMINFSLNNFIWTLRLLKQERNAAIARSAANPAAKMGLHDRDRITQILEAAEEAIKEVLREGSISRMEMLQRKFGSSNVLMVDLAVEFKTLLEAIEYDMETERFYHYPSAKGFLLLQIPANWPHTLTAFSLAKEEVVAAVDCYALGQNTAAVFHFVRIAEYGLRALAKERRIVLARSKKIEWAQWGEVIGALDTEVTRIQRTVSAGRDKDEALAFYTGSIAHLRHIKDKYRNNVMHSRVSFDEGEALSAMTHTRELMESVSQILDEKGRKKKRWKIK